jgi:hypothetical protein
MRAKRENRCTPRSDTCSTVFRVNRMLRGSKDVTSFRMEGSMANSGGGSSSLKVLVKVSLTDDEVWRVEVRPFHIHRFQISECSKNIDRIVFTV